MRRSDEDPNVKGGLIGTLMKGGILIGSLI